MRHDLSDWKKEDKAINTDEMNRLVNEMIAARKDYDDKKEASDEAYHNFESKESLVIKALLAAGLKKYSAPGQPTISVTRELVPHTPKTIEDKRAFYDYVQRTFGADYLENILSINANTVKSLYNKILKDQQEGGVAIPVVPGIHQITEFMKLNRGK